MTTALEWLAYVAPAIDAANSTDVKNKFIGIATSEIDTTLFTETNTYNMAVAYYAAHLLDLSSRDGNSRGVLTMEKEGDLSRSYGGGSSKETNNTQYLDSYKRLIKARVPQFYMQSGSC
tara:strand:- start:167 stop:523 length:357 start_codon:yes stop_codon:yes gene_type:complete